MIEQHLLFTGCLSIQNTFSKLLPQNCYHLNFLYLNRPLRHPYLTDGLLSAQKRWNH